MATDTAPHRPGLRPDGFRRLDHLETGVRRNAKCRPGSHRIRVHVPSSTRSSTYHFVFAWIVLILASGSGGIVTGILTAKGHW